jgi:hypothetical protein
MSHADTGMRVAGVWLAIAAVLLGFVLVGHGPIHPDLSHQMTVIAEGPARWANIHWAAALSLSLFVVTALIVLTTGSRLTESWWTLSAWAVLPVGALWTMTTAVAEATAVTNAAVAGDVARFEAWLAFSEGKANGFMFLALSVAVIAANEARTANGTTPTWAAWVAVVAGVGAFMGWPLGMWFGIGLGSLVWVASAFVMTLWLVWFGFGLARAETNVPTARTSHEAPRSYQHQGGYDGSR